MPHARIRLRFTNKFKVETINSYLDNKKHDVPLCAFCREISLNPATLRTWLKKASKFKAAVQPDEATGRNRASQLTLGGSGRVSATKPIEDALLQFAKDIRREGRTVSHYAIVAEAKWLFPDALEGRSFEACLALCSRMLKRCGLTIRRVTHSGRETKENLEELRLAFFDEVVRHLVVSHVEPHLGLCPRRVLYNMDQTAMFASAGVLTTVDVRGAKIVPVSSGGGEMYCCTMAVTACAGGCILPPHFVFRGTEGGDVERKVSAFADATVATFSVHPKAWFDERVMLEWIDKCWTFIVTEPCILTLDSLTVQKSAVMASKLADMGTMAVYVPGGATSVAQALDVGVMGPLKHHYRTTYAERHVRAPFATTTVTRRREMFELAMEALGCITTQTVMSVFEKAGSYFPIDPAMDPYSVD